MKGDDDSCCCDGETFAVSDSASTRRKGRCVGVSTKGLDSGVEVAERLSVLRVGVDIGDREALRAGHTVGEELSVYTPSSMLGELEMRSIMSSSALSASDSAPSASCPSVWTPLVWVPLLCGSAPSRTSAECSSLISSGSSFAPFSPCQASDRACSSEWRSSRTCWTCACWCGAAGPIPNGAGCAGCLVWSDAEGASWSCKSIVSNQHGQPNRANF